MIVCVLIPRFALTTALGDRGELLQSPVALAPEPGGTQQVGEVSLAAEAFGIHPGMRLGEALARCPQLTLVPPDPAGVADLWERLLVRLESVGAAVEPERPGLVCFDARGLLRLHGGIEGVLRASRSALRLPARFGVAPSRFAAVAAATRARTRRPEIIGGAGGGGRAGHGRAGEPGGVGARGGWGTPGGSEGRELARAYLAPLPVALLRARPALADLPEALERLGIRTLGELADLPAAALADRFGKPGLLAYELARGGDSALSPRPAGEFLREALELPEAASGIQLERGLGLLVDRLLARRERRGRTLRSVVISAKLVERGGTWREQVVFREALADPVRMRLALVPHLAQMPAPAEELRLAVERFGPLASDQRPLLEDPAAARTARLREAIRQARAAAGPEAALRVLEVDPDSRFPERRAVLAPFES
jgi:nucleotidyltransferase/DNA polymerase involved in DNA repair